MSIDEEIDEGMVKSSSDVWKSIEDKSEFKGFKPTYWDFSSNLVVLGKDDDRIAYDFENERIIVRYKMD